LTIQNQGKKMFDDFALYLIRLHTVRPQDVNRLNEALAQGCANTRDSE
jgi:hypothetical protein